MSLDTKYRPQIFGDVVGQKGTVSILRELLQRGEIFQKSYVFSGPSGTGKTTTARILARAMLCPDRDPATAEPCNRCISCREILEKGESFAFKEMDAANNSGAENIRRIIEDLDYYTLGGGDRKIYLIDECHRLSTAAMDALLKPMEDNLPNSRDKRLVCLFCTTEPHKLRGTVKSRCMVFGIREPTRGDIVERLRHICQSEGIVAEDEALDIIFDHGKGHIRDMVNALERVSRVGEVTAQAARAHLGLDVKAKYYAILAALASDLGQALEAADEALQEADAPLVAEGLAEAAMAAYRVRKGVTLGMASLDKKLAADVAQAVGEDILLALAHRVLWGRPPRDRSALVCELLLLHQFVKTGTMPTVGTAAPTHAHTPASAAPASAALQAPAPQVPAPAAAPEGEMPPSTPASPATPEVRKSPQDVAEENKRVAGITIAYGEKAARGVPVKPQKDPLEVFQATRTPQKEARVLPTLPTSYDYQNLRNRFAPKKPLSDS